MEIIKITTCDTLCICPSTTPCTSEFIIVTLSLTQYVPDMTLEYIRIFFMLSPTWRFQKRTFYWNVGARTFHMSLF